MYKDLKFKAFNVARLKCFGYICNAFLHIRITHYKRSVFDKDVHVLERRLL